VKQPISVRQSIGTLSEIMQHVTQHKDLPARITAMRENDTKAMRSFCQIAFGPVDMFADIRETGFTPDYRCRLENVASTESFFGVVQALERITDKARNMRLRQDALNDILDWLHPNEAKIILSIFNHQTLIPGLPLVVVRSVYPNL